MINQELQNYIGGLQEDIASFYWLEPNPVPSIFPLKIDTILEHNHNLDRYLISNYKSVTDFQFTSFFNMLNCVHGDLGGITYCCDTCGDIKFIPFYCHGRVCSRCGKAYANSWGRNLMKRLLPVNHRHMIFTLPAPIWEFVSDRADVLINDMFEAVKATINRIFSDRFPGKKVHVGIIAIVHYTGRRMNYNPHIHVLVTEGCIDNRNHWKPYYYFDYIKVNAYWKYEVLTKFRFHCRDSLELKSKIDQQFKMRFKNGDNGYVVKNFRDFLDLKHIGGYLARYVRHPPIGEKRILGYDGSNVMIKHEWDNKLFETSMPVERFIEAIFSNIPEKGFREVRQWGLYSNTIYKWALKVVIILNQKLIILDYFIEYCPVKKEIKCKKCDKVMEPVVMEYRRGQEWVRLFY